MAETNMYFEDNRDLPHEHRELKVTLLDQPMTFMTDQGVFSKSAIDYGSRVLLENFQVQTGPLLDMGAGYGPIGLTLAKKYQLQVSLIDVNPRALDLCRKNAQRNQVRAHIFESDGYTKVNGLFSSIVSNPPIRAGKLVVHEMIKGAWSHLALGGQLVIVIQKKQGAPSAQKVMKETFGNLKILARDRGYYVLKSERLS